MESWATTAEIDAILVDVIHPLLAPAFVATRRRTWVRARPPIRDLFEIVTLKGRTLVPRWGISLDFVPNVRGNKVHWHRTTKSAMLDVIYDPVDFERDWQRGWAMSTLHGPDRLRSDVERTIPAAFLRAMEWLEPIGEHNLLEWLDRFRVAPRLGGRFGFDNYIQQPLAYAFVLARSAKVARAAEVFEEWAERMDVHNEVRSSLKEHLELASRSA
jgi:hypothetical protein